MRLSCFYLSWLLLLAIPGQTQEISGFWRGKLITGPGGCFPVYQTELQLNCVGDEIRGKAYHFSDSSNFISNEIVGLWDSVKRVALLRETGIVTFRLKEECVPCLKNYEFTLSSGTSENLKELQLRGNWSTPSGRAIDGRTPCAPGTILLTRFEKSVFPAAPAAKPTPPQKIDQLVQEIRLDSGEVQLSFYDNGQIDGDTISVYVNKKPLIVNQMLRAEPIILKIWIDSKQPVREIVMVGENLGQIPPNTALMIVTTRNERHQVYLTADERKNALVRLIFDRGNIQKN
jgi:hypothetical protein